jgi:hypothetical protein
MFPNKTKANHFKQRVPGGADFEPLEFSFDTQKELLEHDLIARWSKKESFYRYSISMNDNPYSYKFFLMVEMEEGKKWWCLGYLDNINDIDLPGWKPIQD